MNPDDIDLLEYELGSSRPEVMAGDDENYNQLYDYIKETDLSVEAHFRFLETWMDMDEFINYQVCEIFCDNVFWPEQNVRMWRERKEGARWRWILFDTDFGFGMPNNRSSGYTNNTLEYATSSNQSGFTAPEWATMILTRLMDNEEFRTRFIQRFDGLLNTVFHPDTVLGVINTLQDNLAPEMQRHIDRWRDGEFYYGDPIRSYSEWNSNVNVMKNFARYRPGYTRQHLVDYFDLSGTSRLEVKVEEPDAGRVEINGIVTVDSSTSGIYCSDVPVVLRAIPCPGYRFDRWEGTGADTLNPTEVTLVEDSLTVKAIFEPMAVSLLPSRISGDTVLARENSPYYTGGDIVVDSGTTLRIQSGVGSSWRSVPA